MSDNYDEEQIFCEWINFSSMLGNIANYKPFSEFTCDEMIEFSHRHFRKLPKKELTYYIKKFYGILPPDENIDEFKLIEKSNKKIK